MPEGTGAVARWRRSPAGAVTVLLGATSALSSLQVQPRLPDRPAPPQPMPVLPPEEVLPRGDEEGR